VIDRRIVFKVVLEVELHVDSRVDESTIEWVVSDQFRSSDGREPFSVEMMQVGFGKAAEVIAERLQDSVAQKLSTQPNQHIQLVAYASAPGSDANGAVEARLTSLARAVVVRDYLIQRGVSGAQIKVRALGNRAEGGGSLDRVDLMVLGS